MCHGKYNLLTVLQNYKLKNRIKPKYSIYKTHNPPTDLFLQLIFSFQPDLSWKFQISSKIYLQFPLLVNTYWKWNVKAVSWHFSGIFNSFMREVPIIQKQSIDIHCKLMDWFLYDKGLRHEIVNVYFKQISRLYCFKTRIWDPISYYDGGLTIFSKKPSTLDVGQSLRYAFVFIPDFNMHFPAQKTLVGYRWATFVRKYRQQYSQTV